MGAWHTGWMSVWHRVATIVVAVLSAAVFVVGSTGVVRFITGQEPGYFDRAADLAMSVFWLAVGAGLLYGFVRKRSPRTWMVTLLVVGALFILVAGTTTHGNVTGSLDYRNWVIAALLLLGIGVAAIAVAFRDTVTSEPSNDLN